MGYAARHNKLAQKDKYTRAKTRKEIWYRKPEADLSLSKILVITVKNGEYWVNNKHLVGFATLSKNYVRYDEAVQEQVAAVTPNFETSTKNADTAGTAGESAPV